MSLFIKNEKGEFVQIPVLPGKDGRDGVDGKSAYAYAKDGGYTGTPEEFAAKLASVGAEQFRISLIANDGGGYSKDKTITEIAAAYDADKLLFCDFAINDTPVTAPLVSYGTIETFGRYAVFSIISDARYSDDPVYLVTVYIVEDNVSVRLSEVARVADIPVVPDKLPNPHALTINGKQYDGSSPVEISVSGADAETETVLSDNLLDKSLLEKGQCFYYGSSGFQLVTAQDMYYGFIPLRGAGTYRTKFVNTQHNSTGNRIALVNDNNEWVQNATATITETEYPNAYDIEFVVTQTMINNGVSKVAFDCWSAYLDTVMIVKDRDYPTEYIPYGYIEVATDSGKKQNNVLMGKTAVFLGDSICAGTTVGNDMPEYGYGWGGLIGEANKMIWDNYGRNGAVVTSIEGQDRIIADQVDTALAEHTTVDYVIFEGGTNDADQLGDSGLGEISADYSTFDTSTFSGALESLILKILSTYPNAKVGYIVAQKMGLVMYDPTSSVRRRYFDRAVEICQKWGIPVIDLWNGSPLNPMLPIYYDKTLDAAGNIAAGKCYTDAQHLTLAGYNKISPQIEAFMRNL